MVTLSSPLPSEVHQRGGSPETRPPEHARRGRTTLLNEGSRNDSQKGEDRIHEIPESLHTGEPSALKLPTQPEPWRQTPIS